MATARTISSLRAGDEVRGVYACVRKDRLKTRTGSAYLALELRDRTGTVQARAFRDADALSGRFERGDLVSVVGRVERFREDLVVEVTDVRRAEPDADGGEQVSVESFLPVAYRDMTSSMASSSTSPLRFTTPATARWSTRCLPTPSFGRTFAARRARATATTRTSAVYSSTRSRWPPSRANSATCTAG